MKSLLALAIFLSRRIAQLLVSLAYRKREAIDPLAVCWLYLVPQRFFLINFSTSWPVDFRSKVTFPKRIKVGKRSFPGISPGCYIAGRNGITIGDNFRSGPNVGLISANHAIDDYEKHLKTPPIIIGDNVWIGMNSVVLPGITIGDNVIIGAGSIVTKDIPNNVIAVGNPCRIIKEKPPYIGELKGKIYGLQDITK